jgi:transcriptional regulator GlxA family with amidase domain
MRFAHSSRTLCVGLGISLTLCSSICVAVEPKEKTPTATRARVPRNVAIFLFQGVELLDFAGPADVFQQAGPAYKVYTVAESAEPIVSQGFVKVVPQYSIQDCPKPDLLVIPGGNTSAPLDSPDVLEWVKRTSGESELTMSVCTGAFILAKAGLLDGKQATTHWSQLARLRNAAPNIEVLDKVRFVDAGKIVTTAGVSAGIDGALHVVDRLSGRSAATWTASAMQYKWDRPSEPNLAPSK